MRVLVVLLCLFGAILAVPEEYGHRNYTISDKLSLERQRLILNLFKNIFNLDHRYNTEYSIEENIDAYTNATAVRKFVASYRKGILLPRATLFTLFHPAHLEEAIDLFKLFYYARDFDTLYKTATWARYAVNKGVFLYALSTALAHRDDTFTFVTPPIYEVNPYYFFDRLSIYSMEEKKHTDSDGFTTHFREVPTFDWANLNKEQSLLYYLNDVGLNSFYYYCNIYYPFWMDGEEFKLKNDRRGEQYYYLYQQFLARYYLERISNDLGEIENFNYEEPFETGYYPLLGYPQGVSFPTRPNSASLSQTSKNSYYDAYIKVQDLEERLRNAIDSSHIIGKDGKLVDLLDSDQINLLGNLVESNPDSLHPHFYGSWQINVRHLLGYSNEALNKYTFIPSALEHFESAMRDPAFYQLYKRIVKLFQRYKSYLPPYTQSELGFPGVKIKKVDFDPLFTYFNDFESDIGYALQESETFSGVLSQKRLNHEPFTYRISVVADKVNEAVVRVYLGPKSNQQEADLPFDINQHRMNFIELDTFRYKLQPGENVIKRSSKDFYWFVPDRTSFKNLYKKVVNAIDTNGQFETDASEAFYGFPARLLLPKGKPEGQVFQVYVIINKFHAPARPEVQQNFYFHRVGTGMNYIDNYAFGFPLDRVVDRLEFDVPNSKFQDVTITHKGHIH